MPDIDAEELRRKAEALLAMDLSVGGIRPEDVLALIDALDAKDREIQRYRQALTEVHRWASSHPRHAYVIHIMDVASAALRLADAPLKASEADRG